jgi:hypothetical protein
MTLVRVRMHMHMHMYDSHHTWLQARLLVAGDSMAGQVFRSAECGLTRRGAKHMPSTAFKAALTGGLGSLTLEHSVFKLPLLAAVGDVGSGAEFEMAFLNVHNANKEALAKINQTTSTVRALYQCTITLPRLKQPTGCRELFDNTPSVIIPPTHHAVCQTDCNCHYFHAPNYRMRAPGQQCR